MGTTEERSGWRILERAATTIWLPNASLNDVVIQTTEARAPEPSETDEWEPEAVLPGRVWDTVDSLDELPIANGTSFRTDRDIALMGPDPHAKRQPVDRYLTSLGKVHRSFGVRQDTPGKMTLTVGDNELRLGLHLDNWDRFPAGKRHASHNRVNLNLGQEDRWFVFADLDVVANHPANAVPSTDTLRELVHRSATPVPVVRFRIPPDWAYIAPTENLLHDGSSEGQSHGSQHVSGLGYFTPTVSAAQTSEQRCADL